MKYFLDSAKLDEIISKSGGGFCILLWNLYMV